MKYLLIVIAILFSTAAGAAPISLEGQRLDAYLERIKPTTNSLPLGRISGFGLDAPFIVVNGDSDKLQYDRLFTLDVDQDSFTIDFIGKARWGDGIVFRLLQADLGFARNTSLWSDLSYNTNIAGLKIDKGPGWISLDLSMVPFTSEHYFTGYFTAAQLPEPSALQILLGFLLVVLNIVRKRAHLNL